MTNQSTYSPFKDFLKKFGKQKLAVIAFFVVITVILISILAPYFIPYNPTIPVTNQYQQKGLDIEHLTTTHIPYSIIYNDGTTGSPMGNPTIESENRRIAQARGVNQNVVVTAVNMGETFVKVTYGDVTSIIRTIVTKSESNDDVIVSVHSNQPNQPLNTGDKFSIELTALLNNQEIVTELELDNLIAEQVTKIEFASLDTNIVSVNSNGEVTAISQGIGTIKINVDNVSTVVKIPVETQETSLYPVGFQFDKYEVELIDMYKHQPPSSLHWFGTDHQNRDIFSWVMMGTRQTLIIGFVSVGIGAFLGTILGLFGGYYGGWVDSLLTRMCDILLAFPGMLLAIAVIAILGPGIFNIIFAVAVFTVPIFIRIVRASAMSLKNATYVEAAKSMGVKDHTIIMRHIFPGTISVVIVYLTMRIGTAILIGASLNYLGLGGDITAPEWGAMLNAAKNSSRNVFHPTLFPGLAIVITVLAFNLLGDGLRDALDPKIRD